MKNGPSGTESGMDGKNLYSVSVRAKAQSSTSCAFCWFVLTLYPTLQGMPARDGATFRAHLQKMHGLKEEILP